MRWRSDENGVRTLVQGLTFSRDRPLLLVRLLTGPDRLGPALRAAMTGRSDHGSG
jgi:hypothetical protein